MNETGTFPKPPNARPAPPPVSVRRTNVPNTLPPNALQLKNNAVGDWFVSVRNGTTLTDVLTPAYWANQVRNLKPGAGVRVVREDRGLIVDLMVDRIEVGMVHMLKLAVYRDAEGQADVTTAEGGKSTEALPDPPKGYKIKHLPNPAGYHAYTPQGERITQGGLTEIQALAAAVDHDVRARTPTA